MSCNRCSDLNRSGQVMGVSGIPEIALRGPGCINGTGLCDGVLGTGGISCNELLNIVNSRCGNVLGTGGSRCNNVLGTGGNKRSNVMGTGGRNKNCCGGYLETPAIVPR